MTRKNPEAKPAAVRVLIVDDHPVVREGLAMHLATQPDLEVCGEAEDVPGALALLESIPARCGHHRHFIEEWQRARADPADKGPTMTRCESSSGRCTRRTSTPNGPFVREPRAI